MPRDRLCQHIKGREQSFHLLKTLKIQLPTCVTKANISLVSKQTALITSNNYSMSFFTPHGLEFLLAQIAIQFVVQNSKKIISITMSAPVNTEPSFVRQTQRLLLL